MSSIASQITSLMIIYSTVYSCKDQRKHQGSASLALVRGIHRWPVNSSHKGPVMQKLFHLMTSSCETAGIWPYIRIYVRRPVLVSEILFSIAIDISRRLFHDPRLAYLPYSLRNGYEIASTIMMRCNPSTFARIGTQNNWKLSKGSIY